MAIARLVGERRHFEGVDLSGAALTDLLDSGDLRLAGTQQAVERLTELLLASFSPQPV